MFIINWSTRYAGPIGGSVSTNRLESYLKGHEFHVEICNMLHAPLRTLKIHDLLCIRLDWFKISKDLRISHGTISYKNHANLVI